MLCSLSLANKVQHEDFDFERRTGNPVANWFVKDNFTRMQSARCLPGIICLHVEPIRRRTRLVTRSAWSGEVSFYRSTRKKIRNFGCIWLFLQTTPSIFKSFTPFFITAIACTAEKGWDLTNSHSKIKNVSLHISVFHPSLQLACLCLHDDECHSKGSNSISKSSGIEW